MKRLFVLLIALVSITAHAQYTCEDLPELRRTLAELTRDCGGRPPREEGKCIARVNSSQFPGYTIEEAIGLCKRAGWSESTCLGAIDCQGFRRICHSQVNSSKYPGFSVNEAIENCKRVGWSEGTCASSVSCEGFSRLCYAQVNSSKFPGESVEEAIATCKRAGWTDGTCASSVSCQ